MTAGSFDYVIVGGGSAGCTLASRLTEHSDVTVALIEAGRDSRGPQVDIPIMASRMFKSSFDWDFSSDPEPALGGRRLYLPRGRMLGGTSSLNGTVYTRGNRLDYDDWAVRGWPEWSYDSVLPYFKRSEDNERGASQYHGAGGPLHVSEGRSLHPLVDAWIQGAVEAGHVANPDFNGETQEGVGRYQLTQHRGLRWSAAHAFLQPAMDRPNLTVLTDALATRVCFEGSRAVGVEVDAPDGLRTIHAEREVILTAGAYQSPQLLLLSGIGPADELRELTIDVRIDLPDVGRNLQDHPGVYVSALSTVESLLHAISPENEDLLRREGRGPMSSNVAEGGGFARSPGCPVDAPDLQFHTLPAMFADEGFATATEHALTVSVYVGKPTSRGSVTLRSNLPQAKPRILHNFLTTGADRQVMRDGLRSVFATLRTSALRGVLRPLEESARADLQPRSEQDQDLDEWINRRMYSNWHPACTCAMGKVVDRELRVYGTEALRVADVSVLPDLIRGNTNAPAIMVAERAADMLLASGPLAVPVAKAA